MKWFGRRLDAPAWEGLQETPTPVGQPCQACPDPILPGDMGVTMPCGGIDHDGLVSWSDGAFHIECHFRAIFGSVEHLNGQCSCFIDNATSTTLSWRDQGKLVMHQLDLVRGYPLLPREEGTP